MKELFLGGEGHQGHIGTGITIAAEDMATDIIRAQNHPADHLLDLFGQRRLSYSGKSVENNQHKY